MNAKTYEHSPEIYARITVGAVRGSEEPAAYLSVTLGDREANAKIWADSVPAVAAGITRGLHYAVGLAAPVILGHPASLPDAITAGGVTAGMEGRTILIGVPPGPASRRLEPEEARTLAAALAVYADRSEAEPDPDVVEELAAVIRSELYPPSESIGLRPAESDRTAARAALRWMKRQQKEVPGA